jgi:RNA polymerase sigma-70 factor, ECF subfamily
VDALNNPEFVAKVVSGDDGAFEELYNRIAGRLRNYYIKRFGFSSQDAEELANDALLQVYDAISSFNPEGKAKLTTWIYKIAIRKGLDRIRWLKRLRQKQAEAPESLGFLPLHLDEEFALLGLQSSGESEGIEKAEADENSPILRAFYSMSQPEQDILRARIIGAMTYKQIAEVEGESEGTLRTRYNRAKKNIIGKCREEIERSHGR